MSTLLDARLLHEIDALCTVAFIVTMPYPHGPRHGFDLDSARSVGAATAETTEATKAAHAYCDKQGKTNGAAKPQ